MFLVYLLKNDNKSYIGYTNDFERRWKQHNCILKGGAKYTTRNKGLNQWEPICIIDGFICKKEAMRCEWKLKRARGYLNRIKYIDYIFNNEKQFTSKGADIDTLNLKIYTKPDYYSYFNNLEIRELEWF
jgi:predicted GIY-YIG superfamily endonuclease